MCSFVYYEYEDKSIYWVDLSVSTCRPSSTVIVRRHWPDADNTRSTGLEFRV